MDQQKTTYFETSPTKVAIMSILSFGIYNSYWSYKHWRTIKEAEGLKIRPFWRGLVSWWYIPALMKILVPAKAGKLGRVYLLLWFSGRLPGAFSLVSVFTFVPLVMTQKDINNRQNSKPRVTVSWMDLVIILLGLLVVIAYALLKIFETSR